MARKTVEESKRKTMGPSSKAIGAKTRPMAMDEKSMQMAKFTLARGKTTSATVLARTTCQTSTLMKAISKRANGTEMVSWTGSLARATQEISARTSCMVKVLISIG